MSPNIIEERNTGVSRAIRNAQRVLLRNDLDPFEFVVEIHQESVDGSKATYVLEISTSDNRVSVRKSGIPRECIDGRGEIGSDDLASFVEGLLPELLGAMKTANAKALKIHVR